MRWWQALRRTYAGRSPLTIAVAVLVVCFVVGGTMVAFAANTLHWTATEQFCTSCHEMAAFPAAEYKDTAHDKSRTGVRPDCSDCHLPQGLVPILIRKIEASTEVWGHFTGVIDTKEKYEKERYRMAAREWKRMLANDSQACRHCHKVTAVDFSKQSDSARAGHEMARTERMTCIECHFGIAHAEPEGPGPREIKARK